MSAEYLGPSIFGNIMSNDLRRLFDGVCYMRFEVVVNLLYLVHPLNLTTKSSTETVMNSTFFLRVINTASVL